MHINFVIRSVVSRGSTVSQNMLALFLFFSTTVIAYINTIPITFTCFLWTTAAVMAMPLVIACRT